MGIRIAIEKRLADRAYRKETKKFQKLLAEHQRRKKSNSQGDDNSKGDEPIENNAAVGSEENFWRHLKISKEEYAELIRFHTDYEARNNVIVFFIGVLFTPITLAGALLGFGRAYHRFGYMRNRRVRLFPMSPVTRVAMIMGAILIWLTIVIMIASALPVIYLGGYKAPLIFGYLIGNTFFSFFVFGSFKLWQVRLNNSFIEGNKFGSARFANPFELYTLENKTGFYIGNGHLFDDKGHILTVAGTRGGKGTNIIIPNLLGAGNVKTSWVIIDPKAENTIITANYQQSIGQEVIILNPWGLFEDRIGKGQSYNPLDVLKLDSPHLVDDVQVIAEMIVPIETGNADKFWSDSARSVITGLLLHLVTSQPPEKRTLTTLWHWVRLGEEDWNTLVQDMGVCSVPVNGPIVKNAANEILKMQMAGDETFGGIIGNALQATDFLKSPALQESLKSGFDPEMLVGGRTTLYIIIPADKLRSHARWLRVLITSMMRAVIRQPKNRVTFLLDEFAALGYLPEIETALSTYAGYNVTVWPILQSLIQLKNLYKDNWETFIANCTVRQYFTVNDNFSADYISKAIGETSHVITTGKTSNGDADVNKRLLMTPDELRRESGRRIFMFIDNLHPTYVDKLPYYLVPEWNSRAEKNPYI